MLRAMTERDGEELPTGAGAPGFDPARARALARHPKRPGARCRAAPGQFVPRVDRTRCEGKADCVAVCPYGVFRVERIDEDEYRSLSRLVRLKLWVHGKQTAYTPGADACRACGLCVVACPEKAITLVEREATS